MHTFEELLSQVDERIAELNMEKQPQRLYDPIRYTLDRGGKRTRPVLVLLGCELFGGEVRQAMDLALAVELFHNFTLLHDDIMDHADKRRGFDTVHVKWNENIAILSGDAMMICAYRLLSKGGGGLLDQLLAIFNRFAIQVCEGQQYDMDFESSDTVSEQDYLRMIELKTAVLMAGALQMGALAGGADAGQSEQLYEMGRNLGLAFQLQDDLLDTYGDPATFGKTPGGDIMSNKKTFLLINAYNRADEQEKSTLHKLMKNASLPRDEKLTAVKRIYERTGVRQLTEERISIYFQKALTLLEALPVEASRKKPLEEMAFWLTHREK